METTIASIRVMSVKAVGGTKGAEDAFDILESKLQSLRGRRFYGAYDRLTEEYRACVATAEGEDASSLGLESWTIPGGKCLTQRVSDWNTKIPQLPQMFDEMANGLKVDPTRPSVEYYRSKSELVLYLPVEE